MKILKMFSISFSLLSHFQQMNHNEIQVSVIYFKLKHIKNTYLLHNIKMVSQTRIRQYVTIHCDID